MTQGLIAPDVVVPKGANLSEGTTVDQGVILTDRLLTEGEVRIERGVIFAAGGSRATHVRSRVRIGAGAVIGPDLEIGFGAQVRPGSVVLSTVPANAIVQGNPARISGYTRAVAAAEGDQIVANVGRENELGVSRTPLGVGDAALYNMARASDLRGSLTVGEFRGEFPFSPARYFIVYDVPSEELRGEHAHKVCHQFLVCVHGSCRALLDDGESRREVALERPDIGLYMPPMIWGTQYRYTRDAVLLVIASHHYDPDDYIRSYGAYRSALGTR